MGKIAERWRVYREDALGDFDLSERDKEIDETLFFGGAAVMFGQVQDLFTTDIPPDEIVSRLRDLYDELREYHEKVRARIN